MGGNWRPRAVRLTQTLTPKLAAGQRTNDAFFNMLPSLQAPAANRVPAPEKQAVALASVATAALLVAMKLVVGITTASLGILSEAAHSVLDLIAAAVTYF